MARLMWRWIAALVFGVTLITFSLALWVGMLPRLQAAAGFLVRHAPESVDPVTERNCYNWDFLNNTGQDPNDLHVRLKGIKNIADVYTGTFNAFGAPDNSSGYNPSAGVYNLNYTGTTVYASDMVHLGICTDSFALRLDQSGGTFPFYWTANQVRVTPDPLFIGVEWGWLGANHLRLHIVNEQNISMTLMALNLLNADSPLTLDDLNNSVVGTLPLAANLAIDPLLLAPHGESFFDVFFAPANLPTRDQTFVLEVAAATWDDPGNTVHLYAQALAPPLGRFMPVINR